MSIPVKIVCNTFEFFGALGYCGGCIGFGVGVTAATVVLAIRSTIDAINAVTQSIFEREFLRPIRDTQVPIMIIQFALQSGFVAIMGYICLIAAPILLQPLM